VRMVAFMPFHSLQQAMSYQQLLSGSDTRLLPHAFFTPVPCISQGPPLSLHATGSDNGNDKGTFQALLLFVQRGSHVIRLSVCLSVIRPD
jgi:hypothetical protein